MESTTSKGAWLGGIAALAAAALLAGWPRARYGLASAAERLGELTDQGIRNLHERVNPRFNRQMAVLDEISQTIDSATTQWEASMVVSKVAAALADDPRLRGQQVGVRLIGGILHLQGDVRGEEEKRLAGEIARRVSGAELVANDLKVASPAG